LVVALAEVALARAVVALAEVLARAVGALAAAVGVAVGALVAVGVAVVAIARVGHTKGGISSPHHNSLLGFFPKSKSSWSADSTYIGAIWWNFNIFYPKGDSHAGFDFGFKHG